MAKEDYVSFEIAKLLKEKGFGEKFDEFCPYSYSTFLPNSPCFGETDLRKGSMKHQTYAPTIQMAMKWLREAHRIDIEVRTHYLNYLKPNDVRYYSGKILKGSEDVIHTIYGKDTYEEVCEAAIKYCLENLI